MVKTVYNAASRGYKMYCAVARGTLTKSYRELSASEVTVERFRQAMMEESRPLRAF